MVCQTMILLNKIPFILPTTVVEENGHTQRVFHPGKKKTLIAKCQKRIAFSVRFVWLRNIVLHYYEATEEFFIPGDSLSLKPEEVWIDDCDQVFFQIQEHADGSLFTLAAYLLEDRWTKEMWTPQDKEGWLAFIEEQEAKEDLRHVFLYAEEDIPSKDQMDQAEDKKEESALDSIKQSLSLFFERGWLSHDKILVVFWAGCFFMGILLGLLT